ncbi:MAG: DNA polymerase III subunit delta [Alloprevotella sp.]
MAAYPATKKNGLTYESVVREVMAGKIAPIYYLMGAESYYIDRISEFIVGTLLKPEERDFNLVTLFGSDATIEQIVTAAKAYPMGARFTVIWVKEAQNLAHLERLEFYLKQPQPTTVLIFCHKNGTLDHRQKIAASIEKAGVLFESKKLSETQLPTFIRDYVKRKKLTVEPNAAAMMAEYVGADLNRLASELDKLALSLSEGETTITEALVRSHVGVSKEFNIFELQDALAEKNVLRANQIANFFDKNPKAYPIQKTLPVLFRFFSNLMLAYYAPDKSERGVAEWVGVTEWQARRSIIPAMKRYTGTKVMKIIDELRRTDARSKGVGNSDIAAGELMRELIYFILH